MNLGFISDTSLEVLVDVGGDSAAAKLSAFIAERGALSTWTVSTGALTSLCLDAMAKEVVAKVLVAGPVTGVCQLLAGTGTVVASTSVSLGAGEKSEVVFRVSPSRARGLTLAP